VVQFILRTTVCAAHDRIHYLFKSLSLFATDGAALALPDTLRIVRVLKARVEPGRVDRRCRPVSATLIAMLLKSNLSWLEMATVAP
jgi:hypothetical protein